MNMKEKQKEEIKQQLGLDIETSSFLEGSLQEISARILNVENRLREENELVKQNPEMFIRFELETSNYYDGDLNTNVYGIRLETDEEFEKRLLQEKKHKEDLERAKEVYRKVSEKKDREKYEELKKKFEQ